MKISEVNIAGRKIGAGAPAFLIAEVGINHNGELEKALEMVSVAKKSGADAVKFQTFRAAEFVGDAKMTFTYKSQGKEVTESMLQMFQRYELSAEAWKVIRKRCDEEGIIFLSTPQNRTDLDILLQVGVPAVKIGSDDFTNLPLLESYARTGLPLIVSCGMSDLADAYKALETIGTYEGYPTVMLVCTSQYPTPPEQANLMRICALSQAFPGLPVGFSDHTQGVTAAVAAVALGASVFEKHFTLSRDLPGPDHWFSEDPTTLTEWVKAIRDAEKMLGTGLVKPSPEEIKNKKEFQRVMVAACPIAVGETFSADNIMMRRMPGGAGFPPGIFSILKGKAARRTYQKGDIIEL